MKNKNFYAKFNELTNNNYSYLRVDSAKLLEDGINFHLIFTIPYEIANSDKFTTDDKVIIQTACENILPSSVKVHVDYRKLAITKDVVKRFVLDFINKEYIKIFDGRYQPQNINIVIENNLVDINIPVDELIYSYCNEKSFLLDLKEYLQDKIWLDINCSVLSVNMAKNTKVAAKRVQETLIDDGIVFMTKKEKICGSMFNNYPYYIAKHDREKINVTVCGKVVDIKKRNRKDNGKLIYNFIIQDPTGQLDCVYFSNGKTGSAFDYVHINTEVYLNGDLKRDNRTKKFQLFVKNAYKADVDFEKTLEKINFVKSQEKKNKVPLPQAYIENQERQLTLLDEQPYIAPILRDKEFIVFDLETTGCDIFKDQIAEIGACKISHGQIVSTFTTLVDPKRPMPFMASEVNHITDNMLKDAPTLEYVLQPFIDYCKDCILVGHNALRFDYPMMKEKAAQLGYNFEFECMDTIVMYKQYKPDAKFAKLSNCLKEFNIVNEEAHRALADTIATAKLFIKLCNEMKI